MARWHANCSKAKRLADIFLNRLRQSHPEWRRPAKELSDYPLARAYRWKSPSIPIKNGLRYATETLQPVRAPSNTGRNEGSSRGSEQPAHHGDAPAGSILAE